MSLVEKFGTSEEAQTRLVEILRVLQRQHRAWYIALGEDAKDKDKEELQAANVEAEPLRQRLGLPAVDTFKKTRCFLSGVLWKGCYNPGENGQAGERVGKIYPEREFSFGPEKEWPLTGNFEWYGTFLEVDSDSRNSHFRLVLEDIPESVRQDIGLD